ncbi:GNAT family N-acetyltransferase [Chitinilyticum piscinae]|uniref:GNAT family N-acetyltransferase n=1 Tax=Chitinilyticum piscinae TaxID=2866724 RepID=A0A8J7FP82_9NEIS|nr:GNAT family N-acetyltransferase [Chitinilyticum piscinae]MBE9607986.1 GNAT family N-acetyltransferase [Chitinilyticum piscinae]
MLKWHWHTLDTIPSRVLFDYLRLRSDIFVVEQTCIFSDMDEYDEAAWHLVGLDEAGRVQAGLRLLAPGVKYTSPSLGRIVLAAPLRGAGLADTLLQEGLRQSEVLYPGCGNRIGAQARLQRFYERQGYVRDGDEYDEDGIPHIEMQFDRPAA